MNFIASHLDTGTGAWGIGVFVAVTDPFKVAVGRGRPGVALKLVCVLAASSVRADAV
jgi:hypothetical protein